jgi:hypothetical protein
MLNYSFTCNINISNSFPIILLGLYNNGNYVAAVSVDFGDTWAYYDFPIGGNYSCLATAKLGTKIFYFSQNGMVTIFDTATSTFAQNKINNPGNGIAIDDGNHYVFFIGENSNIIDVYDAHFPQWNTINISIKRSGFGATFANNKLIIAGKDEVYCIL